MSVLLSSTKIDSSQARRRADIGWNRSGCASAHLQSLHRKDPMSPAETTVRWQSIGKSSAGVQSAA